MAETIEQIQKELTELSGYVSDTPLQPSFGAAGPNEDLSNIVFVENMPVVPEAKLAVLEKYAREKIFSKFGVIAADGVAMPLNGKTGKSEGFAFVTYATPAQAAAAVAVLDKLDFDTMHKLKVMRFEDVAALVHGVRPRQAEPVEMLAGEDDLYWLADEQCRDEFLIRFSNTEKDRDNEPEKHETEVLWANCRGPPALDFGGERHKASGKHWADRYVAWSPRGTYLTTMHKPGAKLWYGKGFKDGFRLEHSEAHEIVWSPDERYVCTGNGFPNNPHPERAFVVWDARTGVELAKFKQAEQQDSRANFTWSPCSKYLARIVTEVLKDGPVELITVYEAPHFRLLDDRSIKAPGARDLAWCPRKHSLLSWTVPERDNVPTSVCIMRIPSREYVRQRQLYNVQDIKVVWHPQGDYCAVYAEKLTKGQMQRKKRAQGGKAVESGPAIIGGVKVVCAGFTVEVFRFDKPKGDVAVEELSVESRVAQFAWEPQAARFALLTGDSSKLAVQFYALQERGITHSFTLENQAVSALHWSPRGEILLLSGLGMALGGMLHFYDTRERKSLAEVAHEVATGLAWDPSGRLVATYKTRPMGRDVLTRDTVGNGYMLWSLQGARVCGSEKPKLFQFAWRPRPEGLLSDDEARDVAKNLKKSVSKYQDEDRARQGRKSLLARMRRLKARNEFRAFLEERLRDWEENRSMSVALGLEGSGGGSATGGGAGGVGDGDGDEEVIREDVEAPISETHTLVEGMGGGGGSGRGGARE